MTFFRTPIYGFLISSNLAHTISNSSIANPPASIPSFLTIQPQLESTMRTSNVSDFINELTESSVTISGLWNLYATTTVQFDIAFMKDIFSLWNSTMANIITVPSLVSSGLAFEPIPTAVTGKSQGQGGESLSLAPQDGNLVPVQLSLTWISASGDDALAAASKNLVNQIDTAAKSQGRYNRWKYLNYADAAGTKMSLRVMVLKVWRISG